MKISGTWAALAVVVMGCGPTDVQVGDAEDGTDVEASALSARSRSYVRLRKDQRRCAAPKCGGYFVQDVNRATVREEYVSGLDFSGSGLSTEVEADVYGAAEQELILFGRLGPTEPVFGTRPFLVSSAWRGMPGVTPAAGDAFFSVTAMNVQCLVAPCPTLRATRLHSTQATVGTSLDTSRASLQGVDDAWLSGRVLTKGALVAGRFRPGHATGINRELVLDASQVFVRLPDVTQSCPRVAPPRCQAGTVASWQRNADRCIMPAGCTTAGACAAVVTTCAPGYQPVSWTGARGCTMTACDPEFLFD
jgi:hypothetical protein